MNVKDIHSIELCREIPFKHCILIKREDGYIIEQIMVEESKEWEQYSLICKKWMQHKDYAGL